MGQQAPDVGLDRIVYRGRDTAQGQVLVDSSRAVAEAQDGIERAALAPKQVAGAGICGLAPTGINALIIRR